MKTTAGTRWKSAVCDTEIVVVKGPAEAGELACGGAAMLPMNGEKPAGGSPAGGLDGGTLLGKRYGDSTSGLEVLCTKGGTGSLSFGARSLDQLETRRLPSSD